MPQIINSGSKPPAKKNSGNALGGVEQNKLIPVVAVCVIAVLIFLYAGYATFGRAKVTPAISAEDTAPPPPGYPNTFPYTSKRWQSGKLLGAGFPLPPSQGGVPPKAGGGGPGTP